MKPLDVKSSTYINSSKEINDEDPKFKFGDIVRRSKYKSMPIFQKAYFRNWSEKVFMIKKFKKLCRGDILLVTLKEKKLLERFKKKCRKKQIKKSLELKK